MMILAILIAVVAIGAAAAASAADAALATADAAEPPSSTGGPAARERTRRTLALGRLAAYLVAGATTWSVLERTLGRASAPLPWALGAVALVIVAEFVARSLGARGGLGIVERFGPAVRVANALLLPVRLPVEASSAVLQRVFPASPRDAQSEEEIATRFRRMVATEAEVSRNEVAILYGVFSLRETSVHEVMAPRVDIVGIDTAAPWSEVVDRVRASEHARLPVYEETVDEIVGILYAKDILHFVLDDEPPAEGWQSLVRPATFIPRSKPIGEQLRDFRASRSHIAIVVDEFGGTAGLVTIEDILEEIVGEIRDEHDEEESDIESRDDTRFWIAGRVSLDEAGETLGVELARDGISTVGGLIYQQLGRVPRAGESFVIAGFRVVVEQVQRRKVKRVYFERVHDREGSAVEVEP